MERDITDAARVARDAKIIEVLGAVPATTREFVKLAAEKLDAKVSYKGSVSMAGLSSATLLDLERDARILASELNLKFARADINDATERYYLDAREQGLAHLRRLIGVRTEFNWLGLVRECFVLDEMTVEFVAAVLKHHVWQVQRKLAGKQVSHHLMPVLHGTQGCGKTYWIAKFLSPIVDAVSYSDFGQIADERIIDLWRSLVIVLDEMAKAAKTDIETVKHLVTASTIERRPMRSNSMVQIAQSASFIGASNHRLIELIRDETGNRRFVELFYRRPSDPAYLSTIDWYAMWGSVQAEDRAPILDVLSELTDQQDDARHRGPVESWLMSLTDQDLQDIARQGGRDGLISSQVLYDDYVAHRARVTASNDREHRSLNTFSNELRRISAADEGAPIRKTRSRKCNGWQVTRATSGLRVAA